MENLQQKEKLKQLEFLRLDFLNNRGMAYKKGVSELIRERWTNIFWSYYLNIELSIRFKKYKYLTTANENFKKLKFFELQHKLGENENGT